jgi:hypothetical protein
MTVATGNAEHETPILLTRHGRSKARAAALFSPDDIRQARTATRHQSTVRVRQRRTGKCLATARLLGQSLEAPEGNRARLAALLANKHVLAEPVAPKPEGSRGRRMPAKWTHQRKVSHAPAQEKITKPPHAILLPEASQPHNIVQ